MARPSPARIQATAEGVPRPRWAKSRATSPTDQQSNAASNSACKVKSPFSDQAIVEAGTASNRTASVNSAQRFASESPATKRAIAADQPDHCFDFRALGCALNQIRTGLTPTSNLDSLVFQ